ncbi:uncharacterized protein LOC9640629 isoform X1 [Selaginella moellendorffii]|uniref:uncharacterized protein LOC9640629 isoform X1 n=1 Tax=Selaginella moellendorffii TaxID=88036 RepID=UPI000D1C61DB|nr:uncharacterized protein LOC9640629 isoform X1 [Selaginella moellendorffii]|eukprot:XP_024532594.1 uncharacterized protein LOC9640629 isoform X1 [Selaginella moellendorffii]
MDSLGLLQGSSYGRSSLAKNQAEGDCVESGGDEKQTLVVVGGGAAGVYGAIWAKTACKHLKVVVLERGHFLSKVKISGGGRCNVTTGLFVEPLVKYSGRGVLLFKFWFQPLSQQYPRGHKELRGSYFREHGPLETAAWFHEHGVPLKTEEDGRMFPVTDDSGTVVECLLNKARRIGVSLKSNALVKDIVPLNGRFDVHFKNKNEPFSEKLQADFALLATGSSPQGYKLAKELGHDLVSPAPSLFTFKVADSKLGELAGVSFEHVSVDLEILCWNKRSVNLRQDGPLLVTHWGLSGPAVLRLSAWAARDLLKVDYKGTLWVDFAPKFSLDEVKKLLVKQKTLSPRRKLDSGAPLVLQLVKRFWQYLIHRQDLNEEAVWYELSNRQLGDLAGLLKRCSFQISGKGEFKDEFVTAGGVPLDEVNLKTMESKKCSNLYLAGELLNVDGITGGFNFQNAWTSGYLSGSAIAKKATSRSL